MASQQLIDTVESYKEYLKGGVDEEVINALIMACQSAYETEKDMDYGLEISKITKKAIRDFISQATDGGTLEWLEEQSQLSATPYAILDTYYNLLKIEGRYVFDSYCLYIEKNRPRKERFYEPRRRTLKQVADKLQLLADDKLDRLFIHMPPRIGKSQIVTMYAAWYCAKHHNQSSLYCTYKESLGGAFLDGVMEIWNDPTYCHHDIFSDIVVVYTDAKNHKVDLHRKKKYRTLSGKGLESGLNGEYDATGMMFIDDIIEGIQDAMNPDILGRKQIVFDNNLKSRAKETCKIVYIGTIWSLHDIYMNEINFLENNPKAKDVRWEILKIPALNDNDESNFDYDYDVGFSTEYYHLLRAKFEDNEDMASFLAQYQQEPIERDGAVFNPDTMHFYNGVLPNEEPIRITAVCDVALGGADYLSFPVAYEYEDGSVYIHDVVFDSSEKDITQPQVIQKIIEHNIGSAFFESNQGGEGYKDDIDRLLKEHKEFNSGRGININSAYAPTSKRKELRIFDNAPEIRKFYFRDDGCRDIQYRKFMNNLYSFTLTGKNKHDDAPDSLSMLYDWMYKSNNRRQAVIMQGLF